MVHLGLTISQMTQAIIFAHTIWDLLLGGQKPNIPRPLDDVILDGVDLDIESGTSTGYAFFVKTLHSLMMADTGSKGRKYYISGAPHCSFPDKFLRPGDGTALGDAWSYFNFCFITVPAAIHLILFCRCGTNGLIGQTL